MEAKDLMSWKVCLGEAVFYLINPWIISFFTNVSLLEVQYSFQGVSVIISSDILFA